MSLLKSMKLDHSIKSNVPLLIMLEILNIYCAVHRYYKGDKEQRKQDKIFFLN